MRKLFSLLSIAVGLVACGGYPITNRACPCTAGYTCCEAICIPESQTCHSDGGVADQSTSGDDAGATTGALIAGAKLGVYGITSDNIIYEDVTTNKLMAVPLAGGAPVQILDHIPNLQPVPLPNALLIWDNASDMASSDANAIGDLSAWTPLQGLISIATSSLAYQYALSDDGTTLMFTRNANANGFVADVAGRYIASQLGTTATTLASNVSFGQNGVCFSSMGIVHGVGFLYACAANDSNTQDTGTLTRYFVADTWQAMQLVNGADQLYYGTNWPKSVNADASQIVVDLISVATLINVGSGMRTVLAADAGDGFFSQDGSAYIFFNFEQSAVARVNVGTTPVVQNLVTGQFSSWGPTSHDRSLALLQGHMTDNGDLGDVELVSTSTATLTTLYAPIDASIFGSDFTADNKFIYFFTNAADGLGTLSAVAVAGGATRTLGANSSTAVYLTGSKIVYDVDAASAPAVMLADLSSSAAPITLATGVQGGIFYNFFVNAARDHIVYSTADGIFVKAVP